MELIYNYEYDHKKSIRRLIMNKFGSLKADLSKLGRMLSDANILIAATTLIRCNKLVSGNIAHF